MFVSPIVPSFGGDDLLHVSVGKDDPREGTPSPAQVESARACDGALNEREARVLKHVLSLLSRQGSEAIGSGVKPAPPIEREAVAEDEVDRALNVAVLKVVPSDVVVESVLRPHKPAIQEGRFVRRDPERHRLFP